MQKQIGKGLRSIFQKACYKYLLLDTIHIAIFSFKESNEVKGPGFMSNEPNITW